MITMVFISNPPLKLITLPDSHTTLDSYNELLMEIGRIHEHSIPATLWWYEMNGQYYLDWKRLTNFHFTLIFNDYIRVSSLLISHIAELLETTVQEEVNWLVEGF